MNNTFSIENMGPVGNQAGRDVNIDQQNNYYGSPQPDPPNSLPEAQGASVHSIERERDAVCLDKTRVDLLEKIYSWADDKNKPCIFWLNGLAGEGKSTIARTVCLHWSEEKRLAASFFFPETGGGIGYARDFVTSIAAQLRRDVAAFEKHISKALSNQPNILKQSLQYQWQRLILDPFSAPEENDCHRPYLLVVDALDQCNDNDTIRIILSLFSKLTLLQTTHLRVFLTSRPEHLITEWFNQRPDALYRRFSLRLNILRCDVDRDIELFLKASIKTSVVREEDIRQLVDRAAGLFKWAEIASRFIGNDPFPEERLAILLNSSSNDSLLQQITGSLLLRASNILFQVMISCGYVRQGLAVKKWLHVRPGNGPAMPKDHLDWIYLNVLVNSLPPDFDAQHIRRFSARIRDVLGSIVVLYSPLSIQSLSKLLSSYQENDIKETLNRFLSILDISRDEDPVVSLPHPSFREFLIDGTRCYDSSFCVDEKQAHQKLADECIRLMLPLKDDICNLVLPGSLAAEVENSTVKQHLPPHVQYACLYWAQHLQKGDIQLHDGDQVYDFLKVHFLHWLEALGWMRRISDAIRSILILEDIAHTSTSPCLHSLIIDMRRFTIYNRSSIELAPLQVYSSALVFTPATSVVKKQFEKKIPSWIQRMPKALNNIALATLEARDQSVNALVFSQNGKRLASVSAEGTIHLWDTESTSVVATFQNPDPYGDAFAYSSNSKRLALGSVSGAIRLWDEESEELVAILEGHEAAVSGLTFSQDGKLLASAASDGTVRLWNSMSGKESHKFDGDHNIGYSVVALSHDGERLAAGATDGSLRLWDSKKIMVKGWRPSEAFVSALVFSRDGQRLASVSFGGIMLWDGKSGTEVAMLESYNYSLSVVTFSEDGKRLASTSSDSSVRLWNAVSGAEIATLRGHIDTATAVVFSPNSKQLASSSFDGTVMIWDAESGAALGMFKGHKARVNAIAFSPDGKWLASGSDDMTIKLWDSRLREEVETTECHSGVVTAVIFSPNGKQLASSSSDGTVRIWDGESGVALGILRGHRSLVLTVTFSPDGQWLASGSVDRTMKLWEGKSRTILGTFEGHTNSVGPVAFSPDGQWLASGSVDYTIKLWDGKSRTILDTLEGHRSSVISIAFSPNGKWLASVSSIEVKLWDIEKREVLMTYNNVSDLVAAAAFSPDGKQLALQYEEFIEIRNINTSNEAIELGETSEVIQFKIRPRTLKQLSYSSDGSYFDTSMGVCRIRPGKQATPERVDLFMSPKGEWIMLGSQRLLRLPAEYRTECAAVKDQRIFLGHYTGELSYFRFDFSRLPHGMVPQQ